MTTSDKMFPSYFCPSLLWKEWPSLPVGIIDAQVVYLNGTVYIGGGTATGNERDDARLYSFRHGVDNTWKIIDTPTYHYALAIYQSQLLLVGGRSYSSKKLTNKILTLKDGSFVKLLPPMKEERCSAHAVGSNSLLAVAGGGGVSGVLSSVEVLRNHKWAVATSLPSEEDIFESAFHDDEWYLVYQTGKIWHVSLEDLVYSVYPCEWELLPDIPENNSIITFLGDLLLSISDGDSSASSIVHAYSSSYQTWKYVTHLSAPICITNTAVLPTGELMVIGCENEEDIETDKIASASLYVLFDIERYGNILKVGEKISSFSELSPIPRRPGIGKGLSRPKEEDKTLEDANYRPTCTVDEHARTIVQLKEKISILEAEIGILKAAGTGDLTDHDHVQQKSVADSLAMQHPVSDSRIHQDQTHSHSSPALTDSSTMDHDTLNLPGVDMLGHTSIVVTNAEQFFCWQAYGFKLYIPPGSLPPGVDRCVLRLSVSLAGQYQFPVGHKLVSAIFWVHCSLPCRLQKQLKLEIQHCAKMMSSTKLAFVRAVCSQESLPYKFKKVEGSGSFSEQSSYGCLEVNHFSGFGVAAEGDVELLYIASLYYLKTDPSKIVIHFTITRDDKCHIAEAQEYFDRLGAKEELYLEVEFIADSISLDIPMPSGVQIGEWHITPHVPPKLSRSRVDSYRPGRKVPSRKLVASLSEDNLTDRVPKRSYMATLIGAREPDNKMVIVLDPFDPTAMQLLSNTEELRTRYNPSTTTAVVPTSPPRVFSEPLRFMSSLLHFASGSLSSYQSIQGSLTRTNEYQSAPVTFDQLVEHVGISKDILEQECTDEHVREIATLLQNWYTYAVALGLQEAQILEIESNKILDPAMKAKKVLCFWKSTYAFKATYSFLIKVCIANHNVDVAEKICMIVKSS